ncbi:MAG: hypothetical protein N2Z69_00565 [Methylophilaceae bacterium]|nr:hypothetical protein [Methylophilaceae bacterium]
MRERVPHLLAYVSGHGYGHVAQVAPVLNRLREMLGNLRLTVCSAVPERHLRSRIAGDFHLIPEATDLGMVMASALDVKVQESLQAYVAFHADWDARVGHEVRRMAALRPDFVLSNVAYLPLAAARRAGIPSAAMCSLNWADILAHYCGALPGVAPILDQMREAYAAADVFLRVTPGMAMAGLPNLRPVGPVARLGRDRRREIDRRLGLAAHEKLVLITLGGIATRLSVEAWPRFPGVHWLVQADWRVRRPDFHALESLGLDFTDILASCDALLCKPGYGSFTEAACNGIPVLYVRRDDWPEQPCLVEWLSRHGSGLELERQALASGTLGNALQELLSRPKPRPVAPDGTAQAAGHLARSISMASP